MNKSEKFWDRTAKYHNTVAKDKAFYDSLEIVKRYIQPEHVVLDYGCSTGLYSLELAEMAKEVHGIDISSKMIEIAQSKGLGNTIFTKTTIFDKYDADTFNVILAFNVLHLVEEEQNVMQRIQQLLKPGGIFISVTPCLGDKVSFLGMVAVLFQKIGILPYLRKYRISELKDLISEQFEIKETRNISASQSLVVAMNRTN